MILLTRFLYISHAILISQQHKSFKTFIRDFIDSFLILKIKSFRLALKVFHLKEFDFLLNRVVEFD